MPLLLLLLFSTAFMVGLAMVVLAIRRPMDTEFSHSRPRLIHEEGPDATAGFPPLPYYGQRPCSWLAIKTRSLAGVQAALKMTNPQPCPLAEGLWGDVKLFVSPPFRGWVLVMGSGLPDPSDDVDACYRFLSNLSRKLGEVQYFSVHPVVQHFSWARLNKGRVLRAFAWAGQTLWNQGKMTDAESSLSMFCPDYGESGGEAMFSNDSGMASNLEKLPLLASRWSLDPGSLEPRAFEARSGLAEY